MAAEQLTLVLHAPPRLVTHMRHGLCQVQIAPVSAGAGMSRQAHKDLPQELVRAHSIVIAGGVLVPGPEAVFVDEFQAVKLSVSGIAFAAGRE